MPEPGYQAYLGGSILAGAEPYIAPLRPENDFLLDLEQVPEAVLRRAKLVFVNYPNNPTAAIAPPEYLERTVAVCRRYGILLAYDNAYCDLTFDGYRAPSIFEIAGARDVALEFFSLSKSFSMTGWRIGFAVGRPELIGALTRVKSYADTGPFLAVQKAGAAALDQAEALVEPDPRRAGAAARRRGRGAAGGRLHGRAAQGRDVSLGARCRPALPRRPSPSGRWRRPGWWCCPGSAFGPAGEGFFRIALTVGADRLRAAAGAAGPDARAPPQGRACAGRLSSSCRRTRRWPLDRDRGQRGACTASSCSAGSRAGRRPAASARAS